MTVMLLLAAAGSCSPFPMLSGQQLCPLLQLKVLVFPSMKAPGKHYSYSMLPAVGETGQCAAMRWDNSLSLAILRANLLILLLVPIKADAGVCTAARHMA